MILLRWSCRVLYRPATRDAPKPQGFHKPLRGAGGYREAFTIQLYPDLSCAVHFVVFVPDTLNLILAESISLSARSD